MKEKVYDGESVLDQPLVRFEGESKLEFAERVALWVRYSNMKKRGMFEWRHRREDEKR